MRSKPPQGPLVAWLLAMIGTINPEPRIGKPAISQNRVQRPKPFGCQHAVKTLTQARRALMDFDKFLEIDCRRPPHTRDDIRQKTKLLQKLRPQGGNA